MAGLRRFRLGILGGAFDPPHVGHVALASAAQEHLGCERLLVLVVADPGHRSTFASAQARLELAALAFADVPGVELEVDEHARTVDFLEQRRPADAVFILGADELAAFPTWKRPERVLELVSLGVAERPGVPEAELRETRARFPAPDRIFFFDLEPVAVSSTEIRRRVAHGEPIDGLVPEAVADAIARLGLYRPPE
jgi:nicotinate-nucleotide adenylyltransferase